MISSRMEKALALVGSESVKNRGNGRYEVYSWDNLPAKYQVRSNYCNCPDYAYRGTEPCAHLLAVSMVKGVMYIS